MSSRFDKIEGIVVALMKDGKLIREVKYPSSMRKEFDAESVESGVE